MDRFWLRPKWLVGHLLVLVLVVLFVNLGFWQLDRRDERRQRNAVIEARSSRPVEPIEQVLDPRDGFDEADSVTYRRVRARGTYDAGGEVLVRARALEGRPGYHVLTPLVLDAGTAVVVNRGWIPFGNDTDPAAALARTPEPAPGTVEVRGLLLASQARQGIGPTDPAEGVLTDLARADVARIQQQVDVDLYPVVLQLEAQRPPVRPAGPVVLPPPEQGEGPHLSYAVQWFLFAAVGVVGWPLLLRHTARERRAGAGPAGDDAADAADASEEQDVGEAVTTTAGD